MTIIVTSAASYPHVNYKEQYKIQLCNTLSTKNEIRECLLNSAEEYHHDMACGAIFLIFIIILVAAALGWSEYRFNRRLYGRRK